MAELYAPPGETSYDLWVERANLNGVILSGIAYGILFVVSLRAILLFLKPSKTRTAWHLIAYICFMFTLATIGFGTNVKFIQMTYIDDRNIPGGPNAFTVQFSTYWVNMLGFVCYIIMGWTANALVLWRFIVIWNYAWLSVIPILIYVGAVSSSIALLVAMDKPGASLWTTEAVKFTIAYASLSVSLETTLTLAIAGRLLLFSNRMKTLGTHSKQYASIAAMLVESSALYSVTVLIFTVSYARNNPFQSLVLPLLGQIQGISPVLILLRIAEGRAWSHRTVTTFTGNIAGAIPLTDEYSITPLDQVHFHVSKEDPSVYGLNVDRARWNEVVV